MNDKDEFLRIAEMDIVKSSNVRKLNLSRNELIDIYKKYPEYDSIILFLRIIHPDILDIIARNGDDRVRGFVCQKYPLLLETYEFLLQQKEGVRAALCGNKTLPDHIVEALLNDNSKLVKERMREILEYQKQKEEKKIEREKVKNLRHSKK